MLAAWGVTLSLSLTSADTFVVTHFIHCTPVGACIIYICRGTGGAGEGGGGTCDVFVLST